MQLSQQTLINVSFGLLILIKMRYLLNGQKSKFIPIALWIIALFLTGNAIGSLITTATNISYIFSPLKLVLAFLTIRLAIEN